GQARGRGPAWEMENDSFNEGEMELFFESLKDKGVNSIAEINNRGRVFRTWGKPVLPFNSNEISFDYNNPSSVMPEYAIDINFLNDGSLVHAKIIPPKFDDKRKFKFNKKGNMVPLKRRVILMEMVPKDAIMLQKRASVELVVNFLAVAFLFFIVTVFVRMSARYEKLEKQIIKDSQLKALGKMSAVLGHEIKNTISSIKGHSQLLVESSKGTDMEEGAGYIERDISYLQELTGQILDFAKTGSLKIEKVYLDDLAEGAVEFSDYDNIDIKIDASTPWFMLDRDKMQRVLINLLNNGASLNTDKRVQLNIKCDSSLKIEVADNGGGVDKEVEDRIFEPFFTTKAKGTGLGLAFVKQIVESHNGTIVLQNNPKKGATFIIEIPKS
ncbi:MAG: hypothetical protein JXR91_04650, partial [Deltaproteobacteria bacterium]|nr:hypothetical protein [Deltaproteobacteria bacterium]